jgi:8-oxo-dGTP diphosphatase
METPLTVVAAVIERDGRILICRRSSHDSHPLKWEFPGGKVRPGEDPASALRRELVEELGVHADIGDEIARCEWRYEEGPPLLLIFYRARIVAGEPVNRVFAEIRWELPERLPDHDFLEADRALVRQLARGERN